MQKLKTKPVFDSLNLYSERAHRLLELVRQDWEQTHLYTNLKLAVSM